MMKRTLMALLLAATLATPAGAGDAGRGNGLEVQVYTLTPNFFVVPNDNVPITIIAYNDNWQHYEVARDVGWARAWVPEGWYLAYEIEPRGYQVIYSRRRSFQEVDEVWILVVPKEESDDVTR